MTDALPPSFIAGIPLMQPPPVDSGADPAAVDVDVDVGSELEFFYSNGIGFFIVNRDGVILCMSPYAANIVQCMQPKVASNAIWAPFKQSVPGLQDYLTSTRKPRKPFGALIELPPKTLNASASLIYVQVNMQRSSHVTVHLTDCSNLLELERLKFSKILHDTTHIDTLTHLASRQGVTEYLRDAITQIGKDKVSAVVVTKIDIRKFNKLNLAYGYQECDRLLVHLAHHLAKKFEFTGQVGRVGNDEFSVIASTHDIDQTIADISHAVKQIESAPYPGNNGPVSFQLAMGFAASLSASDTAESLMTKARSALRVAQSQPTMQSNVYVQRYSEQAKRRQLLVNAMSNSVTELFSGFEVCYQPIVSIKTRQWVAVESLLRWQLPDGSRVSPEEFIPLAEETEMINALGLMVLERSLREQLIMRERLGRERFPKVSVNVSAVQLNSSAFVERAALLLRDHPAGAEAVQIEITESAAPHGSEAFHRLQTLKETGVKIALDDFGTGYSSLSNLHLLNVDVLKIDKSFIDGIPGNAYKQALIASMIGVAPTLNVDTVAEGVETEAQLNLLSTLGCDCAQGYHFAKPMALRPLIQRLSEMNGEPPV